ncbi:claw keratin [Anolis carolinensis]|uniref:Keratin n=1 Tax=Anolis carolinensis TaxID=28377 RepID=H9GCU2_ANOCA|nr:PREDICTED: claw keratin-like [Anolis carolinensis]|eukprot:XP_008117324.1 PREDICTED: claw keratin-like [Anolis carolinensis]
MANCGPASAVPSCEATPTVAFGSGGARGLGRGLVSGYGSNFGYGSGLVSGYGLGGNIESAANLGVLSGVNPSCINQIPSSEAVINPPPFVVTIPGPVLSATPEPLLVGGNTPCAVSGVGLSGLGDGSFGGLYGGLRGLDNGYFGGVYGGINRGLNFGLLGVRSGFVGRRGSICGSCI